MARSAPLSLSSFLAQGSLLDLIAAAQEKEAQARCTTPARLLILQCGGKKNPAAGLMPARERYAGPLWQSYRKADPTSSKAFAAVLSAKYGLLDVREGIEAYDVELNNKTAAAMAAAGTFTAYPVAEKRTYATAAGAARYAEKVSQVRRVSPATTLNRMLQESGRPLREVCIVGGARYAAVAQAWFAEWVALGLVAKDCKLTVITDEIGRMRNRMNTWINEGA